VMLLSIEEFNSMNETIYLLGSASNVCVRATRLAWVAKSMQLRSS